MNSLASPPRAKLPRSQPSRMLTPPRSLLTVGASFLTTRTTRKLRHGSDAVPAQERTFAHLRSQLALTAYGRIQGIETNTPYNEFQTRVPLQTYEGFLPYIERMKTGEAGVLGRDLAVFTRSPRGPRPDAPNISPSPTRCWSIFAKRASIPCSITRPA